MESLHNIIENPLMRETHKRQRAELLLQFPKLGSCPHVHFLLLRKYLLSSPHRFYLESVYSKLYWLETRDKKDRNNLQNYLSSITAELNRSFLYLEEINSYDHFEKLDDYELIRFIDQEIHPTYLRLVEAVFYPIIRIAAYYSRLDRGKNTEGLDLWNTVQEIKNSNLSEATKPYRHIVRNGIAHGGVTYLQKEILYHDKKGNKEKYNDSDVIKNFDDFLDTCNGLALSLTIFLLSHQPFGYELTQQLLIDELRAETETPWWQIIGCIPSEFTGLNQLLIYACSKTYDYRKVQMSAFQTGILAEQFAPGFDRYFLSIRSRKSLPGWAAFDGKRLRQLRLKGNPKLEEYKGVIENDLIFYVPHWKLPKFISRFNTYKFSFLLHWQNGIADIRKQLGLLNITVREAIIHRNSWGCVLNGSVYIKAQKIEINKNLIKKSCRRIVHKALSNARSHTSRMKLERYLPLGFARVSVFQKDYRRRRLSGYGLEKDLVCTVQVQKIKRIKSPDLFGSTIENIGKRYLSR